MKVIVIGSGIAGVSFAEHYRKLSPDADITLLTRENEGYYSRPLLSRGFSEQDIEENIILKTFDDLRQQAICIIGDVEVTTVNPLDRSLVVRKGNDDERLAYDKLVIATGSSAFIPPPFLPYRKNFFLLNSLRDLIALRRFRQSILDKGAKPSWGLIGGGLIGCELGSDLAVSGDRVTLFHAMDRLMERQLMEDDSEKLLGVLKDMRIDVKLNQAVRSIEKKAVRTLICSNDHCEEYDAAIVSCGFKPRTELAEKAGLETGRGILVDPFLRTSNEHIHAVGDVAQLPNGKLYAYIIPIRHQARWLAEYFSGRQTESWEAPDFSPEAKVHGFEAAHPYRF